MSRRHATKEEHLTSVRFRDRSDAAREACRRARADGYYHPVIKCKYLNASGYSSHYHFHVGKPEPRIPSFDESGVTLTPMQLAIINALYASSSLLSVPAIAHATKLIGQHRFVEIGYACDELVASKILYQRKNMPGKKRGTKYYQLSDVMRASLDKRAEVMDGRG